MTEETLFHQALLKPPEEREAFLIDACAGKPELLGAVKSLLVAHEASSGFLKHPPEELAQTDGPKPVPGWGDLTGAYTPNPEGPKPSHDGPSYLTSPGPGLVIAGRYTLVEKIGEGGMGVVWIANQTEPIKRKVALKVIRAGMDSGSVLTRFEQERQALALMDHPNIARVLDGGMTPTGQPFFVMELVNGLPLNKFCDEARLPLRERLELFVPICQAIQHAHQKGIIHRDLKPANILITLVDGRPTPKVIDFGVAKATGDKIIEDSISTHFGAVVGTLEYMSPEQAGLSNEGIDTRSDIYSLGVILYELLTGLRPFDPTRLKKAALTEVIRIIREEDPSRPSTRLSTDESLPSLAAMRRIEPRKLMSMLRGELDWVVMKCLEKSRDRRYETANGLARDIQRYLADEPVEARPPSTGYRLGKFIRRNKGVVIATILVFLSLVGGIIGTSLGLIQAEKNRADAETAWGQEALRAEGEREAKEREAKQRERAEKARDRTREALDAMTSNIAGDSLSTQDVVTEDQKKFLNEVLLYYKEFSGENQDDENSRARASKAAYRVGLIESRLGKVDLAFLAFKKSKEGYKSLSKDYPSNSIYRDFLGRCHIHLGNQLNANNIENEAINEFLEAIDIYDKLIVIYPENDKYHIELLRAKNNQASILKNKKNLIKALEIYLFIVKTSEELTIKFPMENGFFEQLSRSYFSLGDLEAEFGQFKKAFNYYEKSLRIRESLAINNPKAPMFRKALANTYHSIGKSLRSFDKKDDAVKMYLKSIEITNALVADFPMVPSYRSDLSRFYGDMANILYSLDKTSESIDCHKKSISLTANLAKDFPKTPSYRQDLAVAYSNFGVVLKSKEKKDECIEQFKTAISIQEKLILEYPDNLDYQLYLARSYGNLGALFIQMKKNDEAEEQLAGAIKIFQKLSTEFPNIPKHRNDLSKSLNLLSDLCVVQKKYLKAIGYANTAFEIQKKLAIEFPGISEYKNQLAKSSEKLLWAHRNKALSLHALGRHEETLNDWEKVLELIPKSEMHLARGRRAYAWVQTGKTNEAIKEVQELLQIKPLNNNKNLWRSDNFFNFSCIFCIASKNNPEKKQEYEDKAMELLYKAFKEGYKDLANISQNSDLDPLRKREDFKKLLTTMNSKSDPNMQKNP